MVQVCGMSGGGKNKEAIREAILDPDKVVVSGYPAGVMKATLTSTGFYQKISLEGLERIVEYLSWFERQALGNNPYEEASKPS